jgi:hypothetical protein
MPRLQREIVTELLRGQPHVEVIASSAPAGTIPEEAARSRATVVILGRDDPRAARRLLETLPRLLVLTLADRELTAWSYGLTPYRESLGELSAPALSAAIHARAGLPPWWTE